MSYSSKTAAFFLILLGIDGSAAAGLTISGGNTHRVFFVDVAGGSVAIQDLALVDGRALGGDLAAGREGMGEFIVMLHRAAQRLAGRDIWRFRVVVR